MKNYELKLTGTLERIIDVLGCVVERGADKFSVSMTAPQCGFPWSGGGDCDGPTINTTTTTSDVVTYNISYATQYQLVIQGAKKPLMKLLAALAKKSFFDEMHPEFSRCDMITWSWTLPMRGNTYIS